MKRIIGRFLSLVLFTFGFSPGWPQTITLPVEEVTNDVGMATDSVNDILQDHLGYIWFATNLGIVRHDGHEFTVFRKANTLPTPLSSDYDFSLAEDLSGDLWVGTSDGLNRFNRRSETFTTFRSDPQNSDSISANEIAHLFFRPSAPEILGVATITNGWNQLNLKTGRATRFLANPQRPGALRSKFVLLAVEDSRKRIWVGSSDGFHRFHPESGTFEAFLHDPKNVNSISDDFILSIYESPRQPGVLWIGTRGGGLNRFDPDRNTWTCFHPPVLTPPSPESDLISAINAYSADSDKLFVGTRRGLYVFGMNDAKWQRVVFLTHGQEIDTHSEGIPVIFQDRTGIQWISIWGRNLYKFTPIQIRYRYHHRPPSAEAEFRNNSIRSMTEDEESGLWLATSSDGVLHYDPVYNQYQHVILNPGKAESNTFRFATTIRRTRDGDLWIATMGGLVRLDPARNRQTVFPFKEEDPETLGFGRVASITEDTSGNVWIGSDDCLSVWQRETGNFKRFFSDPNDPGSLSHSHINPILEDRSGTLWIGTANGLNRYERRTGTFRRFYLDPQETNKGTQNYVLWLHEDRTGRLWIGTSNGLSAMDREGENVHFHRFTVPGSSLRNFIMGILEDDAGNFWVSSPGGLTRFDTRTQTFSNYDSRDWFHPICFNYGSCLRTKDGRLYFGGVWGMISFKPEETQYNRYIPPLIFTDFRINNRPVSVGSGSPLECPISLCRSITLPYTMNNLTFECASLSYIRPEKNQYAYRLDGRDSSWNYLGYERRIHLDNLLPGTYVLRAKGSNNDGVWNESGTILQIRILPAFWQTWWFKAAWIAFLLSVFLVWHQTRMKRLAERIRTESAMKEFCLKFNVSEREREIVQLILKGKSNKEIEEELFIALGTVKNHIYNIYQKLNVESRTQLVNLFKNLRT